MTAFDSSFDTHGLPRHWLERSLHASLSGSTAAFWMGLAESLSEVLPDDVLVVWEAFSVTLYTLNEGALPAAETNSLAASELRAPQLYNALNLAFQVGVRSFDQRALTQGDLAEHPLLAPLQPLQACALDLLRPDGQIGAAIIIYGSADKTDLRHGFLERWRSTIEGVYWSLVDQRRQVATGIALGEFLREVPVGLIMADWFKNVLVVNDEGHRHAVIWNEGSNRASVKDARNRFDVAAEIVGGWDLLQSAWIDCLRTSAPPPAPLVITNVRDPTLKATVSLVRSNGPQAETPCFMTRFSSVYTRAADAVFNPTPRQMSVLADLSPAERSVAILVRQGMSNREIADRLGREISTIKDHLSNIYSKTGFRGRSQVIHALNAS